MLGLLAAVVVAVLVWFLIGRNVHFGRLADDLSRAQVAWLPLCLVGQVLSFVAYTFLYRAVAGARGGPRPGFRTTVRITLAMFGAFAVGSSAGSLATSYWALRRMRQQPTRATAQVLAINTAEWALLTFLAATSSMLLLAGVGPSAPLAVELGWIVTLPVCLPAALWVSGHRRGHLTEDRGNRFRRAFAAAVSSVVMLRYVLADRGARLRALAGGLLFWGGRFLTAWAALRAFNVALPWPSLTVAYATGYAATLLPLPVGGIGGVDAAQIFALRLVGVPLGRALLSTLVARTFSFWLPVLPAVLAGRSIRRLHHDLPRVPGGQRPEALS